MKLDVKFNETDKSFAVQYESGDQTVGLDFDTIQMCKGETGKSAYELALENGFEGSEEEWIASLHGRDGVDGYTPVRGTDYWTEADKAEIQSYVNEAILGGEW